MTQQTQAVSQQAPTAPTLANFLSFPKTKTFLEDALKDKKTEFVSNLLALYDNDKNIRECDPSKLMMCAMNATALNLPLNKNLGYAYVIAYKGIPQFQIGYKGLIQLALRSGAYRFLNACEVREKEIERNKFTGEIKFLGENESGNIIGYLAYLELTNGFRASLYMSESQIETHALKFSTAYKYDIANKKRESKWSDKDIRPKMAMKTVLKGLLGTYGILSTEMIQALDNDNENEVEYTGHRNINVEIVPTQQPDPNTSEPEKFNMNVPNS